MPDSQCAKTERGVQPPFSKSSLFSGLLLGGLVLAAALWLRANRPPLTLPAGPVTVRWEAIDLPSLDHHRARLAGAWRLQIKDRRVGGFSGLALDRGSLLALTDSGVLAWLPRPPGGRSAIVRPLPAVAGNPATKVGRDSEGITRTGRAWWVVFEQNHQLIRYDRSFTRVLERRPLDISGARKNRGAEALSANGGLTIYPEASGISDATTAPGGQLFLLKRRFGLAGFRARIVWAGGEIALPTGMLDNPEGIAAEALAGGGTRLWVITDNDQRRWLETLLVAIDLPAEGR